MLIHADGTGCDHGGQPGQSPDGAGPVCGAGWLVAWVQAGNQRLTLAEACESVAAMAEAFARALTPVFAAYAQMCAAFTDSPEVQALAAAGDILDGARGDDPGEDEQSGVRASLRFPPLPKQPRGLAGDPCGSPPQLLRPAGG